MIVEIDDTKVSPPAGARVSEFGRMVVKLGKVGRWQ